jgi:hypothetical protein
MWASDTAAILPREAMKCTYQEGHAINYSPPPLKQPLELGRTSVTSHTEIMKLARYYQLISGKVELKLSALFWLGKTMTFFFSGTGV